ncbi:MAG: hypothetical protein PHW03_05830 [Eubacteriales bacterium]|nr:hypothetical protein [Eubacteriales bacterium]MDD4390306.1 hypothetical protein [Eubacteriales bacterium]
MTKKEIEQIYHLNNEVKMWQRELDRLRCKSIAGGAVLSNAPVKNCVGDSTGELASSIVNCEEIINGKLAEVQFARSRIITYIASVDDSYMRQVLFYRNCSLMSWKQVASELGEGYTSEAVRLSYYRFFQERKM